MDEEVREVDVNQMLNETIVNENDNLERFEVGTSERDQVIDALEKFYKLRIEENKESDEDFNNQEKRKLELQMHEEKMELERDRMKLDRERLEFERVQSSNDIEAKHAEMKSVAGWK